MIKRKNVLLLILSTTMIFGVTALSLNEKSNKILAAQVPTSRTFTFDKDHRASGYSATTSGGTISYTQTNATTSGGYIEVSGEYGSTTDQIMDFASTDYWISSSSTGTDGLRSLQINFYIQGITHVSYVIDCPDANKDTTSADCYVQVRDSSYNLLGSVSGTGSAGADMDKAGTSKFAQLYIFRYSAFTVTSITFTYDCQGKLS